MLQMFKPGDILIYQLESAYGLLRILAIEENGSEIIWHVAAYGDFFPDVDAVEEALKLPELLKIDRPHIALTNRAFESTQVAKMGNLPLSDLDLETYQKFLQLDKPEISDRSVRLMLGLR